MDDLELLDFYRTITDEELRRLQRAFTLDRADGALSTLCDSRLAIIDTVLRERAASLTVPPNREVREGDCRAVPGWRRVPRSIAYAWQRLKGSLERG